MKSCRHIVLALSLAAPAAWGQTLHLLPSEMYITGLSADGRTASGRTPLSPFVWTAENGASVINGTFGAAFGISGDGSTLVGGSSSVQPPQAARWSGSGPTQLLGRLGNATETIAFGANNDGSIIAGYATFGQVNTYTRGFRWTAATGMQPLPAGRQGDFSWNVAGMSRDGSTIVGTSTDGISNVGVAWRGSTIELLPGLPDSGANSTVVGGTNATGDIIVGTSNIFAVMWRNGQVIRLGQVGDFFQSRAVCVNDDGSVVGGYNQTPSGARATVWTPETGIVQLDQYLSQYGISVPAGVTLAQCTAVSADGRTFAGYCAAPGREGFVVTIPSPGTLMLLALSPLFTRSRRRAIDPRTWTP